MKPNRFIVLFLIAFLSTAVNVSGNELQVGSIISVSGSVAVVKDDDVELKAKKDLPLFEGYRITTEKGSYVVFSLENVGRFHLDEEAEAAIDELSSEKDDGWHPVLRLVIGFLRSQVSDLKSEEGILHTPTAVLGVRGTEFDTVVSIDATTAVAVDNGAVQIESDGEKVVLEKGRMVELDIDERISPVTQAPARENRRWGEWRNKKAEAFLKRLPSKAPVYTKRFEKRSSRFIEFAARIKDTSLSIFGIIEKIEQAKRQKKRKALRNLRRKLVVETASFIKMSMAYRRAQNRLRTMGEMSVRMERFVEKNKGGFSSNDLKTIQSNLKTVSDKRKILAATARETTALIRKTMKDLKRIRNRKWNVTTP